MIFVKPWIRIRNYSLTGWPARANFQFVYSQLLHLNFPPGKLKANATNVAALLLTCVSAVLDRACNASARAYSVRKQLSELRLVITYITKIKYESKWFHCSQKLLIFFPHDIYFMILNIQQYGRNITNSNNPVPW